MTTPRITIKTSVDKELVKANVKLRRELTRAMSQAADHIRKEVSGYTQARPSPLNYVRTYRLKRGWAVRKLKWNYAKIGVRGVPYAPYVMDELLQADIHRGRWWTTASVVEEQRDKITAMHQKAVTAALKKFG